MKIFKLNNPIITSHKINQMSFIELFSNRLATITETFKINFLIKVLIREVNENENEDDDADYEDRPKIFQDTNFDDEYSMKYRKDTRTENKIYDE